MAIGDIQDFVRRLRAALPRRWFPELSSDAPVLTGVLTGIASIWASLFDLLQYTMRQSRIATASGVFLDMIATDFFAGRITRFTAEGDQHFRLRILAEILRPRATRAAVEQALFDLTGLEPVIFEPANTTDTGGYNLGGVGYGVAGGWGDINMPFQFFVTAFEPAGGGVANIGGYGNLELNIPTTGSSGGYGQGAAEWADLEMVQGAITADDIYSLVAATIPAATIAWTRGLPASEARNTQQISVAAFARSVSAAYGTISVTAGLLLTSISRAKSAGRLAFTSTAAALVASGLGRAAGALVTPGPALVGIGLGTASGRLRALAAGEMILIAAGAGRAFGGVQSGTLSAKMQASALGTGSGQSLATQQQSGPTAPTVVASDATTTTVTLTWIPTDGAP